MDKEPDKTPVKDLLQEVSNTLDTMKKDTATIKSDLSYIKARLSIPVPETKSQETQTPQGSWWWS